MSRPVQIAHQSDRDHWLKIRYDYVTASECSEVLGVNRYRTPRQTFIKKVAREVEEESAHLNRGKEYEPLVLEMYKRQSGAKVRGCQAMYTNPKYPWLACSPDSFVRLDGRKMIGEFKTPSRPIKDESVKEYKYQVLCQMLVMGYECAELVCGVPEIKYFDPADDPRKKPGDKIPYKTYMIDLGLPYFAPNAEGEWVQIIHTTPPIAKLRYDKVRRIPFELGKDFPQKTIEAFLERTHAFHESLGKGFLPLHLW